MSNKVYEVLVLGAGFAGIGAAIKLSKKGISNFVVLEKDNAIGGTWYGNTYPGAACDVPSHFYCYSFYPNPQWSRKFAPQNEILQYINDAADNFDVRKFVKLNKTVESFTFDERRGLWNVSVKGGEVYQARHILNGMGGLHKPNIPNFQGLDRFAGPMMHSAAWNHQVDFEGKHVAIVGSAASAIQIIPELQKVCAQVDIYQRTPNFIAPRNDRDFTAKEKRRFEKWPFFARMYRWLIYKQMELFVYPLTRQGSRLATGATNRLVGWIRSIVTDKELQEKLIPDYTIGCKRILLSDSFYQTLERKNVAVISSGIDEMKPDGIRTQDGVLNKADIIVFATGFDLPGHLHSIEVVGKGAVTMKNLGYDGEMAFKGAMHSQFPNYFMITGPNTGVGTSSVVYMIELQLDYLLKLIEACVPGHTIAVKPESLQRFNEEIQKELSQSVWASGCDSWYLRDDGKITTLFPGNARKFAKQHRRLDLENYDIVALESI